MKKANDLMKSFPNIKGLNKSVFCQLYAELLNISPIKDVSMISKAFNMVGNLINYKNFPRFRALVDVLVILYFNI